MELRNMFQEEATEVGGVEEKKERVSDLGDCKNGGAVDRNRDLWGGGWLPVEFDLMGGKTGRHAAVEMQNRDSEKRSREKENCKSQTVENMKTEGWVNIS